MSFVVRAVVGSGVSGKQVAGRWARGVSSGSRVGSAGGVGAGGGSGSPGGTSKRGAAVRWAGRLALALALLHGAARPADATLITYAFGGTVQMDQINLYFPGKNVGDAYSGTFTLDTAGTLIASGVGYAGYSGGFGVTVDNVPYNVLSFRVWSSGPSGTPDGFEFGLQAASGHSGFLSLRSGSDIYAVPNVPTAVNLGDMTILARLDFSTGGFPGQTDRGSITWLTLVPEPGTGLLVAAGLAVLGRSRRSRR